MISLTKNQLANLMVSMVLIRLYLSLPRDMFVYAGNAAWILVIYITLIATLLFYINTKVYKNNESILEIAERTGGRLFKIIVGILSMALILLKTTGHIKLFIESIQIVLLQNSATELIVIFLSVAMIFGAYAGIESLAIISGLFLPVVITVLIGFLIFLIPNFNFLNILPIFGAGLKNIFFDGMRIVYLFGDLFILNFLLPYCKNEDVLKKSGYKAIVMNGIIFFIFMIVYAGVVPYPVSSEYIIPIFHLTRIVEIGDFFGRLEAFFEFIWAISFFIYGAINIWVLSIIWQKTFNLKYHEPLIIPMSFFSIALGFLQPDIQKIINTNSYFAWIVIVFAFFIPIIFGILSNIKSKKGCQN